MRSTRILQRPQSRDLSVDITQELEPCFIGEEGGIRNTDRFHLNKICKPFTVTYSFFMISLFQFLHRCYFAWEEFQLFSDRFMRCCKPDIFLLCQLVQWFDGLRSIESEMSKNFSPLNLDDLSLLSASNTEPVPRNFSVSLRTALRRGTGVTVDFSANCSCTKSAYLLPLRKKRSTRETLSLIERTTVSKTELNN